MYASTARESPPSTSGPNWSVLERRVPTPFLSLLPFMDGMDLEMGDFLSIGRAVAAVVKEFVIMTWCNAYRARGCVVER